MILKVSKIIFNTSLFTMLMLKDTVSKGCQIEPDKYSGFCLVVSE